MGGERTKKATVTAALEEYIARREQAKIIEHFGTMAWDPGYDYKADRRSRDRKLDAARRGLRLRGAPHLVADPGRMSEA